VRVLTIIGVLAALLLSAGCGNELTNPANEPGEFETQYSKNEPSMDLVGTAIAAGFNTLVDAVEAAELAGALSGDDPLTVFAPTDAAFGALPSGLLEQLLLPENRDKLQQILTYHVVAGAVRSSDLGFYQSVPTLEGSNLDILRFFRFIKVNDARVSLADVLATNGVIHVIDRVLIPPDFTLEDAASPMADIVDTAIAAGFDTLVKAVVAAELVEPLRNEGLTVFAPTDEAFAKLPPQLLAALLEPANRAQLQELLLYHVAGDVLRAENLRRWQFVRMLNEGFTLVRKPYDGRVLINQALVSSPNVEATNGIIHVIDEVLIPLSFYGAMPGLASTPPADHAELRAAEELGID